MNLPDYPFTSKYSTVNGNRMHYIDEGEASAEPIVMLHGNPSWSFYFRQPVLALSSQYRCIVPDHIGMGMSDKPGTDDYSFTLTDRVDDVETFLEQLQVRDNITLVLHDWGGMIGMAYACRHPHRIKRLIILNSAAFHLPDKLSLPWQLSLARTPLLGPFLILGLNAFCLGAAGSGVVRRPMMPAVRAAYLAPYDSWTRRIPVLRFVQDIPLHRDHPSYAAVSAVEEGLQQFKNTPMLLCWGLQDFVFHAGFLEHWIRYFPDAEISRFKDAGHYVLEDAGDEIILLIKQFLDQHPLETEPGH